jgi:flagellar motility protein MotE (MotC chaperone)
VASSNKKTAKKKRTHKKTLVLTQSTRPAKPLFRLIPLTITAASALLCLKTIEIYQTGRSIQQELFVSTVQAEEKKAATPATESTHTEATTGEEAPPPEVAPEEEIPKDWVEERASEYNQRELDVLESLANRRKKLDQWEKDVSLREKVLIATEERIDQKLAELNGMSTELKDLLVTYDKEEDAKVSSLVKVYEAMKPKDAARIFDELDMDILLMVVDRMSERRVAPILAAMSPQKAKDLTQELADQKKNKPAQLEPEPAGGAYSPPLF